ncbi:hypothetical protein CVT91_03440 [Candidatus Atribacteria bacterium HGW-Atribacteria-1]|nr:MAG: hypothetical protein CVT91_03440 [Candidatus Atribacteria bacterium HGW-Atribacteria-1]
MAKKERLGSDPFKESSLDWIHNTREEKKDSKELKKQKPKELKRQSVLALKRLNVKTSKRFSVKTSKKQNKIKEAEPKKRHTIYLSSKQSKKLKVYAAGNDMKLSEVIEKLINENI